MVRYYTVVVRGNLLTGVDEVDVIAAHPGPFVNNQIRWTFLVEVDGDLALQRLRRLARSGTIETFQLARDGWFPDAQGWGALVSENGTHWKAYRSDPTNVIPIDGTSRRAAHQAPRRR